MIVAKNTQSTLKNKVIYSVYVRNHSEDGNFEGVTKDLKRIAGLGVDILWLLPIHPIGTKNKKGDLGCPYSIRDFTGVNPEYGTEADFINLIETAHGLGLKVMIDVVYNHTSHDSVYKEENPDYFYKTQTGHFGNKIADWSDIIDLDYSNKALWTQQIKALVKWVKLGVDGFRCDVAPLVPMEFWKTAREQVEAVNPQVVWLAETVHSHFAEYARNHGVYLASDAQTFDAFDICYDYDTHSEFMGYLQGDNCLEALLEKKRMQETLYPENYVKARFLENHDNPRAKKMIPNTKQLNNWTAFSFFEKGSTLLYAGQEACDTNTPSLFDKDPVRWSQGHDAYEKLIKRLSQIKKDPMFAIGRYKIHKIPKHDVILATYVDKNEVLYGIFNVGQKVGSVNLHVSDHGYVKMPELKDGDYKNLISGGSVHVKEGHLDLLEEPIIFRV